VRYLKDPTTEWEFTLACWRWLRGATLAACTWEFNRLTGAGAAPMVEQSATISADGQDAVVVATGGAVDEEWAVTAHLTASDGRTRDRTVQVLIRQE
jgi:hypothetical protein